MNKLKLIKLSLDSETSTGKLLLLEIIIMLYITYKVLVLYSGTENLFYMYVPVPYRYVVCSVLYMLLWLTTKVVSNILPGFKMLCDHCHISKAC